MRTRASEKEKETHWHVGHVQHNGQINLFKYLVFLILEGGCVSSFILLCVVVPNGTKLHLCAHICLVVARIRSGAVLCVLAGRVKLSLLKLKLFICLLHPHIPHPW